MKIIPITVLFCLASLVSVGQKVWKSQNCNGAQLAFKVYGEFPNRSKVELWSSNSKSWVAATIISQTKDYIKVRSGDAIHEFWYRGGKVTAKGKGYSCVFE